VKVYTIRVLSSFHLKRKNDNNYIIIFVMHALTDCSHYRFKANKQVVTQRDNTIKISSFFLAIACKTMYI